MAYTPTNWLTGNTVTAGLLNNIETGLAEVRRSNVDVSVWADTTGATDASAGLQSMIDSSPTGSRFHFPGNAVFKISNTVKVLGSRASVEMIGHGPRSYNEADGSVVGTLLLGDAGVKIFQFGDDSPSTVSYRGPTIRNITFREAGDAGTSTLVEFRAVVNWTVENCNFRGSSVGIKADNQTYDASWGFIAHPMFYKVKRCVYAIGADFTAVGGNYSTLEWAFYLEPNTNVQSVAKLLGVKIDGSGTGGGVYSEGALLDAHGVEMEFGTTNNQFGYKFVRDVAKHANSGRGNRVVGGSITGRSGSTGHTGVSVGSGCDKTEIWVPEAVNLTTKISDSGTGTRYTFAGDGFTSNLALGTPHYAINDGSGVSLLDIRAEGATTPQLLLKKSGAKLLFKLAAATVNDEVIVRDSADVNLFRFQGNGGSTIGLSTGTQTVAGALKHTGSTAGFYNATPVSKAASPGTAAGTDAAVINAIVTALRNLGLVT